MKVRELSELLARENPEAEVELENPAEPIDSLRLAVSGVFTDAADDTVVVGYIDPEVE